MKEALSPYCHPFAALWGSLEAKVFSAKLPALMELSLWLGAGSSFFRTSGLPAPLIDTLILLSPPAFWVYWSIMLNHVLPWKLQFIPGRFRALNFETAEWELALIVGAGRRQWKTDREPLTAQFRMSCFFFSLLRMEMLPWACVDASFI